MGKVGVAIVETNKGILLTKKSGDDVYRLPGGEPKKGETHFMAAIRALEEKTGLMAHYAEEIFSGILGEKRSQRTGNQEYIGFTVVLIKASGKPKSKMFREISYYNEDVNIATYNNMIIKRYLNNNL